MSQDSLHHEVSTMIAANLCIVEWDQCFLLSQQLFVRHLVFELAWIHSMLLAVVFHQRVRRDRVPLFNILKDRRPQIISLLTDFSQVFRIIALLALIHANQWRKGLLE